MSRSFALVVSNACPVTYTRMPCASHVLIDSDPGGGNVKIHIRKACADAFGEMGEMADVISSSDGSCIPQTNDPEERSVPYDPYQVRHATKDQQSIDILHVSPCHNLSRGFGGTRTTLHYLYFAVLRTFSSASP
mmetsp:Transcript_2594/g.7208  ORF Transcript_2594/g.7208 Transcript_2594/m.7208 type:complete len:134 (-) Transcript_2594:223-624(-)|eukprot:CAMPEP_0198118132 /NCGR_PEP_ID=MMETSP1442-20131203/20456_1 /TAXON_ID= /ORGANISM="Craspedostauros australis, Strain CCMP3328" /LENGTH=133 /DNA_ID=CAMNT_0043776335 /DNA_START=1051 /DNA_END=1452 /DNA_ORIENTATION=-